MSRELGLIVNNCNDFLINPKDFLKNADKHDVVRFKNFDVATWVHRCK